MPGECRIRELSADEIRGIYAFAKLLNPDMTKQRFDMLIGQMLDDGYRCAGKFDDEKLIAICGFWVRSQLFCGRSVEPDNVVTLDNYRSQGHGKKLMQWVEVKAKEEGCETSFLKSLVTNSPSHKFYHNHGYKILGFGFYKELADKELKEAA